MAGVRSLLLAILLMSGSVACEKSDRGASAQAPWDRVPSNGSIWYTPSSDTVIVFVHGILGDSRSTWLRQDRRLSAQYWPELVKTDKEAFAGVSVFIAGYSTQVGSARFSMADAATQLYSGLQAPHTGGADNVSVLNKKNIIFVCHSMGGILTRYILYHHREDFKGKRVGLALYASPSYGSPWANTLDLLIRTYQLEQARQLKVGNDFLVELDDHFRDLLDSSRAMPQRGLAALLGFEALESHFIVHWKWVPLFTSSVVVDKASGGRYFGAARVVPETDHSTLVRPDSIDHESHRMLRAFYRGPFVRTLIYDAETRVQDLRKSIRELRGRYQSMSQYPSERNVILREAEPRGDEMSTVESRYLNLGHQITKFEYMALAYGLAAEVSGDRMERRRVSRKAVESARTAIELIRDAESHAWSQDGEQTSRWIRDKRVKQNTLYFAAWARAIEWASGGPSTREDVRENLRQIDLADSNFLKEFPPEKDRSLAVALGRE